MVAPFAVGININRFASAPSLVILLSLAMPSYRTLFGSYGPNQSSVWKMETMRY